MPWRPIVGPDVLERPAFTGSGSNGCSHSSDDHKRPRDTPDRMPGQAKRTVTSAALDEDSIFDLSDQRALRDPKAARPAARSIDTQADDNLRTRNATSRPASRKEAIARRRDLDGNAREMEAQSLALETELKYDTAFNWWTKFVAYIMLPVRILSFNPSSQTAVNAVHSICRQFLQYTHRCIGMHRRNSGPADPDTSFTYWQRIVRLHRRHHIDISFTDTTAKRWLSGAKRVQSTIFGPRLKKKKAMFSLQHIIDLYEASWSSVAGKVNPKRRILVLKAAPQLAIQVLFRASEYLKPGRETFSHTVHLSRAHVTYYSWDWSHEYTPEELTPANLTALLASGKARALVRMPRLKNDQFLDRGFPPASLELNEGPLCALRYLLMMEIDDPITTLKARQCTPMFVDPDTNTGLTKIALAKAIIHLTHLILTNKYKRNVPLKEIRRQWSLHSFRVTGQNLLREAGVDEYIIRQAGRWLSNCVLRYDRPNLERHATAAAQMGSASPSMPTHLSTPGLTVYPYPIVTRHPSLEEHPEAKAKTEPGTYTLSAESQAQLYFREPGSTHHQPPEVQKYLETLRTHPTKSPAKT